MLHFTAGAVIDTTPPVISGCPSTVQVTAALGEMSAAASWISPTATDNSGSVSTSSSHTPKSIFPVGTTRVTYTFEDAAGNQAICQFDVIIFAGEFSQRKFDLMCLAK